MTIFKITVFWQNTNLQDLWGISASVNNYLGLFATHFLQTLGIVTLAINWFPGVIASIHLLTNQGHELGFVKTLLCCGENHLVT